MHAGVVKTLRRSAAAREGPARSAEPSGTRAQVRPRRAQALRCIAAPNMHAKRDKAQRGHRTRRSNFFLRAGKDQSREDTMKANRPARLASACAAARRVLICSLLCGVTLALDAAAQDKSLAPGINQPFIDKPEYDAWASSFEREGREVFDKRNEIVAAS